MFKTRVTEMLGIKYPIIAGGMQWLSVAEFAAAVSNAGGLGLITSSTFSTADGLRQEIRKTKSLTGKPFGVNINLFPAFKSVDPRQYIEIVIEEGIKIVETSGRSPEQYIPLFKQGGITVMHKCTGVRFARTAERVGCAIIIIDGSECAGHPGEDDVTSLILIPRTVDSVTIPVVAAGGFGDARGFLAALSLGAEGVLMGTRFMATKECWLHPRIKEWLVNATEMDTVLIQRSLHNTVRAAKTDVAQKVIEMEARGTTLEELRPVITGENTRKAFTSGNINDGLIACGQVVGLIDSVPTVKETIDSIIEGAGDIHKKLSVTGIYQPFRHIKK